MSCFVALVQCRICTTEFTAFFSAEEDGDSQHCASCGAEDSKVLEFVSGPSIEP